MSLPRKPNVLLIDNDDGVVHAIATRLTYLGCICIPANTGLQGLSQFREGTVDLVITDLNMPTMDGAALIRDIRAQSDVPVITITGFRRDFDRELRDLEGVDVLEKPFRTQDLVDLVSDVAAAGGGLSPLQTEAIERLRTRLAI